ncbi:MAG: T9SS type A sorting domain-containing protein [Bacteroidota bacterium]
MVKKKNDGTLRYKPSYLDDCIRDDELADVVYLRSGDKEKALGVITNRRANYFTLGSGDCIEDSLITDPAFEDTIDLVAPKHSTKGSLDEDELETADSLLQVYGSLEPGSNENRLRVRNMDLGFLATPKRYTIKYYSPYDQQYALKSETRWAPILTLEFPEFDTLDIVLFEVFQYNGSFKNNDTDNSSTDTTSRSNANSIDLEDEISIFPNPNDSSFNVFLQNHKAYRSIELFNSMGKMVYSKETVGGQNKINVKNIPTGVYYLHLIAIDEVVTRKIIIE